MNMNQVDQLFAQAETAFNLGQFDAAHDCLVTLQHLTDEHPAVLHLHALVEKGRGNFIVALALFEKAMNLAPYDSNMLGNAANLYSSMGNTDTALLLYGRAIEIDSNHFDFRFNRAISLLEAHRSNEAIHDIDFLEEHCHQDPKYWSIAGEVYLATRQYDRGRIAFERSLAINPNRPTALNGLAEILTEQGDPAGIKIFKHILTLRPDDREAALSLAEAMEADGDSKSAIALLRSWLTKHPDWITGHRAAGRILSELGEVDQIIPLFESSLKLTESTPELFGTYAAMMRDADESAVALDIIQRADDLLGFDPILALIAAGIADKVGDTGHSSVLLGKIPSDYLPACVVRIRHHIRSGNPSAGMALAKQMIARDSSNVEGWALLSICWRMLDDKYERWLNPDGLSSEIEIGIPGSANALGSYLRELHHAKARPLGQSLRNGTQTRGYLFARENPILAELSERISVAIQAYMLKLPDYDADHPLLRYKGMLSRFSGSWSVRLTEGGFHISHIHPHGVLSSAYYVSLPPEIENGNDKAGWLEVGGAPPELNSGLKPHYCFKPKPGFMILFPSYLYHGTRPFNVGERLTIAFDIGFK
jgi:uncharacterized protein (TIGR02466 family)